MAEIIKKPVGGAYGIFMNEKRAEFQEQASAAGDKSFGAVGRMASAAWKELGDELRATYEEKYKAAKDKFEEFKNSESYVAPEKKEKKQKGEKASKAPRDKDAPKKPVGGAYGVLMNEKREEFKKQAAAAGDKSFGAGAKIASAAWKAISEEEKALYEERYKAVKAKYDADSAVYRANRPETPEAPTPTKDPAPQKRRVTSSTNVPPQKRQATRVATLKEGVPLDEAVLKEAGGLDLRGKLENLSRRNDIVQAGVDGAKLLRALRAAGGSVPKAAVAVLGH